jgi:hypothetical protein
MQMLKQHWYSNVVLTVIFGLLAWLALGRVDSRSVHAQPSTQHYAVEVVTANFGSHTFQGDLASAISNAAKGRELVTVLNHDQPGKYLVVFK